MSRSDPDTPCVLESVAMIEYGTRVTKKRDAGTQFPVYGGGGATFAIDRFNRQDCFIVSRFGMSEECVRYVSGRFFLNDSGLTVTSKDTCRLYQRYLDYFLLSKQPEIYALGRGTAQKNLNVENFKRLGIEIPSLEEQKRIVALLDQAFAALDRARSNAETNLADAEELFDSWLTAVFHEHPSSWKVAKLSQLCHRITVGHVGPMAKRYSSSGTPFLRSQNVRAFYVDLADVKFIDDKFRSELKKSELKPGDVAIVRTGYPGTAAVIPDDLPLANCADLVIARPKDELVPEFLAMFLNSSFGKKMVAEKAVGAAQKHFNVGAAKNVDFAYPELKTQRSLVSDATEVRAYASSLARQFEAKLDETDQLRRSILANAFAGGLN